MTMDFGKHPRLHSSCHTSCHSSCRRDRTRSARERVIQTLCILLFATLIITLSSCGGGGGSSAAQDPPQIAGNWQFTMTTDGDSFIDSPLQGGFLLQKNGAITGQIGFSIVLP